MDILKNRNSLCFRRESKDGHPGKRFVEVRYFGLLEYVCRKLETSVKAAR